MAKIQVKTHLIDIQRVKNPSGGRSSFLRLDKNENTIDFSNELMEIFKNQITPEFLSTYPELDNLYKKIADYLSLKEENIYIASGSDAVIKSAFEVFIGKGDKVALLDPTYAMYYVYREIFQAEPVNIGFKADLSQDLEDILDLIGKEKPKLICLANPNAPTGTVIQQDNLKKIIDLCLRNDAVVLIDEAYYPYYPHSAISLISDYPNLIISRTFSKAMGLASSRLGFAAGSKEIIDCLHKVRPMYETNAFAARFGEVILDNYHVIEKNIAEVSEAKAYLEKELDSLGLPYFKSYANFILINTASPKKALWLKDEMKKKKILITAGFKYFPLENCIRVTVGSKAQMKHFINNLKQII